MDSNRSGSSDDRLPEIYLSPSKIGKFNSLRPTVVDSSKVWANVSEAGISMDENTCKPDREEIRRLTPGSKSPRDPSSLLVSHSQKSAVEGTNSSLSLDQGFIFRPEIDPSRGWELPSEYLVDLQQKNSSADSNTITSMSIKKCTDGKSNVRPSVLEHCEEFTTSGCITDLKDLGSSDGEDSTKDKDFRYFNYPRPFQEVGSIGSQSENTDSTSTVLDLQRDQIPGCEAQNANWLLKKPYFLVGGPISHQMVSQSDVSGNFKLGKDDDEILSQKSKLDNESLTSAPSVQSTHHPDSSECVTPPSVQSISSIASSKKLEWDSGADLGYNRKKALSLPTNALSTLERMAIGNYASLLLITEADGTTNTRSKWKLPKNNERDLRTNKSAKGRPMKGSGLIYSSQSSKLSERSFISTSEGEEHKLSPKRKVKNRYRKSDHKENFEIVNEKKCSNVIEKSSSLSAMNLVTRQTSRFLGKFSHSSASMVPDEINFNSKLNKESSLSSTLVNSALSLPYYSVSSCSNTPKSFKSKSLQDLHSQAVPNEEAAEDQLKFPSKVDQITKGSPLEEDSATADSTLSSQTLANLSDISLTSVNSALRALSHKLATYIDNLIMLGSFGSLSDYDKLRDYIEFVGMPSRNDEEVQLKQSVADIIMRMFGDISNSEGRKSSVLMSYTSDILPNTSVQEESSIPQDEKEIVVSSKGENLKNIFCIPYRPSSASRTYFLATAEAKSETGVFEQNEPISEETHDLEVPRGDDFQQEADRSLFHEEEDTLNASKSLYQDRHGMIHVAHQPPGYNSFGDSHLSESTSENEANKMADNELSEELQHHSREAESSHDRGRHFGAVWTSSGSESAYETIRERHRNVGEALASSFEFYSTSPREARVLGFISSDNDCNDEVVPNRSGLSLHPRTSDVAYISHAHYRSADMGVGSSRLNVQSHEKDIFSSSSSHIEECVPRKVQRKPFKKAKQPHRPKTLVGHESEGASSNVSVVQIQRKRYIRRIRKYIHILERLERTLIPTSLDSMGSRKSSSRRSGHHKMKAISSDESLGSYVCHSSDATIGSSHESDFHGTKSDSSTLELKALDGTSQDSIPRRGAKEDLDPPSQEWGTFSDFQKLMSSDAMPGDMRTHKFLLKSFQDTDKEVKSIADVRRSQKGFRKLKSGTGEVGVTQKAPVRLKCKAPSQKPTEGLTVKRRDELSGKDTSVPLERAIGVEEGKLTREFGQMFPSNSDLLRLHDKRNSVMSKVVGTQTVVSEPENPIQGAKCELPETLPAALPNKLVREAAIIAKPQPHSTSLSVLDGINLKIAENATKINDALQSYNKRFGYTHSRHNELVDETLSKQITNTNDKRRKQLDVVGDRPLSQDELFGIVLNTQAVRNELFGVETYLPDPQTFTGEAPGVPELTKTKQTVRLEDPSAFCPCSEEEKASSDTITALKKAKSGMKFVVSVSSKTETRTKRRAPFQDTENYILSLQEALALAKPHYMKEAEKRRLKIQRKRMIRQELQSHNRSILAELPDNLKTPTVLRKFLHKSEETPLFSYKAMREQNLKWYQNLPEAQQDLLLWRKMGKTKTNKLMSSFYSQKLRGKVLKGQVSHAHRNIITPTR